MIILKGQEKDLGGGFKVRRVLPSIEKRFVGPFVFLDHFGPTPLVTGKELTVRQHPHIGLATITYLYEGTLLHKDSLGTKQLIRPFETNWMTAGRGISHSEHSQLDPAFSQLEGIQTWLALPKEAEEIQPFFQHIPQASIPELHKDGITLRLLGGRFSSIQASVDVYSALFYADVELETGAKASWPIPSYEESGLYVSKGKIQVQGQMIEPGSMAVFELGEEVSFEALETSRLVFLGGEPFPEKRHIYWNFVSTSQDRIEKAKVEWKEERFPSVPGETDRIPLPD